MEHSRNNKFLIVAPTVVLTPLIDGVITELDTWFEMYGRTARVTSGLRSAQQQLEIIRHYAKINNVDKEFPRVMTCSLLSKYMFNAMSVYEWQPALSRLLNMNVIIAPPFQMIALFDYVRDGVNKRGQIINPSPHFRGTAFDIGGATGKPDVSDELEVVKAAYESKEIANYKGYLIERQNNCVHSDCSIPDGGDPSMTTAIPREPEQTGLA